MSARKARKTKNDQIGSDIVPRPKRPKRPKLMSRGDGNTEAERIVNTCGLLNDFCLLQIFNRLDIKDLCNVADVSHQFKQVSKISFTGRRATGNLQNYLDAFSNYEKRRVLCKFGDSIKSMRWEASNRPLANMNEISRFCGGTLDELNVQTGTLNCDDALRTLFSSLKTLTINCDAFTGDAGRLFSECQELKILRLKRIPCTGSTHVSEVAQKYGKLEELHVEDGIFGFLPKAKRCQVRTINLLLKLNLHIKKLDIFDYDAHQTIYDFASKMDGLEVLVLRHNRDRQNCYKNVTKMAGLKSLKVLELHGAGPDFVAAIEAMENVPIERFKWVRCPADLQFFDRIGKWKSLKSLALRGVSLPLGGSLAELIEQMPLLHELELGFENQNESVGCIMKLVERFPKLDALAIHTFHPELFDQQFYDALLEVIVRRPSSSGSKSLKVSIYSDFHATKYLQMHRKLEVMFLGYGNDSLSHCVCFKRRVVPKRPKLVPSFYRRESFGFRGCIRSYKGTY